MPVKEVGPVERLLIKSMILTMHNHKGIGLAAPQVGLNQRIIVLDVGQGPMAVINPQILKKSGSEVLEEGCLSLPGVTLPIKRAQRIKIKYIDENNAEVEAECEDLMARVIQHETDHLDGKLILDYAGKDEKKQLEEQLKEIQQRS